MNHDYKPLTAPNDNVLKLKKNTSVHATTVGNVARRRCEGKGRQFQVCFSSTAEDIMQTTLLAAPYLIATASPTQLSSIKKICILVLFFY